MNPALPAHLTIYDLDGTEVDYAYRAEVAHLTVDVPENVGAVILALEAAAEGGALARCEGRGCQDKPTANPVGPYLDDRDDPDGEGVRVYRGFIECAVVVTHVGQTYVVCADCFTPALFRIDPAWRAPDPRLVGVDPGPEPF